MNPYDPDPLDSTFMFEDEREMYEQMAIRRARLQAVALMGGSAAIVIVAVLLVWRWVL